MLQLRHLVHQSLLLSSEVWTLILVRTPQGSSRRLKLSCRCRSRPFLYQRAVPKAVTLEEGLRSLLDQLSPLIINSTKRDHPMKGLLTSTALWTSWRSKRWPWRHVINNQTARSIFLPSSHLPRSRRVGVLNTYLISNINFWQAPRRLLETPTCWRKLIITNLDKELLTIKKDRVVLHKCQWTQTIFFSLWFLETTQGW
jgi:hypothetical protein